MITADTITDEQIRELREEAWELYARACVALGTYPIGGGGTDPDVKREARYACAEILNARGGK